MFLGVYIFEIPNAAILVFFFLGGGELCISTVSFRGVGVYLQEWVSSLTAIYRSGYLLYLQE